MKKKITLGMIILACFACICICFLGVRKKQVISNAGIQIEFEQTYYSLKTPVEVKVKGAKEKKCTFSWYLDDEELSCEESSYQPCEEDLEKTLTVKVQYRDYEATKSIYLSKLPVIYVYAKDEIRDEKQTVSVAMQTSEKLKKEAVYEGQGCISLRGNSTKHRTKHPYVLKLDEKTDLLGLGSCKHWVLLAEDIDHTLVRNRLVMYFADAIGLDYTCKATSVSLFLNDSYQGVYTLIEQVRVGEEQIDILDYKELAQKLARNLVYEDACLTNIISEKKQNQKLKETIEQYGLTQEADTLENALLGKMTWLSYPYEVTYNGNVYDASTYVDIPQINGGWVLEADFYHNKMDSDSVRTNYWQPFYFHTPERAWTNTEFKTQVAKYIQTFEYALHSEDFVYHENAPKYKVVSGKYDWIHGWDAKEESVKYSDAEHDGYRYDDLFDMDSLVNYFLVCEFSRNWDSMKNSVFLYKDQDKKACMGPVWDYDWAFGNINMYQINTNFTKGWQTTDNYFANEQLYQNFNWNRYLIKDPVFVKALYEKYWEIRPTLIEDMIREDGLLTQWKDELQEAGEKNDKRWSYTYQQYRSYKYDKSWEELTKFIQKRVKWLDEQFVDEVTLYESLNSYRQAIQMN